MWNTLHAYFSYNTVDPKIQLLESHAFWIPTTLSDTGDTFPESH